MTSQSTSIYTPFADGRTVRDIVEHTPALVRETWCRDLLRHTLDSLERQYATGAPHRPVSPDTIVMLNNNEALLLPAPEEVGPAGGATLAADLHALALVVHYAITAELPPDGPLGPRLYDGYSEELTKGIDRCLGPNQRLRPKTIAEMRSLLGLATAAADEPAQVAPAMPAAHAEIAAEPPAQEAASPSELPADGLSPAALASLDGTAAPMDSTMDAAMDVTPAPHTSPAVPEEAVAPAQQPAQEPAPPAQQDAAPVPDFGQAFPEPVTQEVRAAAPAAPEPKTEVRHDAPPATPSRPSSISGDAATLAQASGPTRRADTAFPAGDARLLRTPAAASAATTPAAPATSPTANAAANPASVPGFVQAAQRRDQQAARRASGRVQRWGWIAGAVIVLLAAGSALIHFLQENDSRDMVALSLPPAERTANGLDKGETVVAPRTNAADPAAAGTVPADAAAVDGAAVTDPATDAAAAGAAPAPLPPTAASVPGRTGEAVVNGTTYKLLIKPWGTVYVDGVDRGVSPPVKRLTLGRGQHTIRIVNPNFPEHVLNVDAGTQESATIEHDFTAKAE